LSVGIVIFIGSSTIYDSEIIPSTNKATVINSKNQLTDEVIIGYIESQKREGEKREEDMKRIKEYMNPTQQ